MGGERTIGDCVGLQRGNTYKSARLGEPGPYLLGLASIRPEGGFRDDNLRTYGGETSEKLLLRPGDIYVSLKDVTQSGSLLGSVARVPPAIQLGRVTQDTVKLLLKSAAPDKDYIYWLLRTPEYRAYCRERAIGTTNLSLAREDFLNFEVPDYGPEQRCLVGLLNDLDDKIELNRRMARTLEGMVRALFRSWFVDFDPVHAKVEGRDPALSADAADLFPDFFGDDGLPEGWGFMRADEIAALVRDGVEPSSLDPETPYVGLEHLPKRQLILGDQGHASDVDSVKTRFEKGDLLFGKLRPYFHKVSIAPAAGICSSDIFVFRAKLAVPPPYLYLAFSEDSFVAAAMGGSTGTRMPRADWGHLSNEVFAVGDEPVMRAFADTTAPVLARAAGLAAENRTLAALRDTLLPSLISGGLRIPDAEALVEEAA